MLKVEREHYDKLAQIGCIICQMPAEIHHQRSKTGLGTKSSYLLALPLCPTHHRTGGYSIAFHAGKKAWEAKFGTQEELLAKVNELLGITPDNDSPNNGDQS